VIEMTEDRCEIGEILSRGECVLPVVYRKYRDTGEVVALFPTLPADDMGHVTSYMHVGQHSGANYGHVVGHTSIATRQDYAVLERELKSRGYENLKAYRRETPRMQEERRKYRKTYWVRRD